MACPMFVTKPGDERPYLDVQILGEPLIALADSGSRDKISKISDIEADVNAIQLEIECLVDDEELDSHFAYREQFTTQLETLVAEANRSFGKIYCWSDSTIVLNWLQTPPHMFKQFVNNRVAEIQERSANFEWRHVSSGDNLADLVTRGLSPENLIKNDLWWHGPHWLKQSSTHWPCSSIERVEVPEQRRVLHIQLSTIDISFERFSNLLRLQRSFAYVLRIISNCRNSKTPTTSYLPVEELSNSLCSVIKISQIQSFYEDYSNLLNCRKLGANSKLLSLNPFLDEKGVLRVGGRLSNSEYAYDKKHTIIIDSHHQLSKLIFRNTEVQKEPANRLFGK
nr:unnamed protein product [Callosobruchus analis]